MIRVLFFAKLRENLGVESLDLGFDSDIQSIHDIIARIRDQRGNDFADNITADGIVTALNHQIVKGNPPVNDGDEVAFFPPVSGG
ncbi:Molybdopterin synthase sulfur carrier subunit [BD1-7 clade bacterium]|uniref:Molybdopterin synthase sulfur carrier subunit n=1 Tax=BD1-7 clade bacterium TaxID=2029982 RepID=A0A5S9QSZ0_9GAMM|nr:Molybdopterin synthase sulfur carrier subunit [BD1-7 clade bacterium]CAA0122604.1 Molybdopterin synthase sulfur carrier subunit [BD1-7 clade bacterium]